MFHEWQLDEAFEYAERILGYPCPCEQCSNDGGAAKSVEIADLAYDLAGITPKQKWPPAKGRRLVATVPGERARDKE